MEVHTLKEIVRWGCEKKTFLGMFDPMCKKKCTFRFILFENVSIKKNNSYEKKKKYKNGLTRII